TISTPTNNNRRRCTLVIAVSVTNASTGLPLAHKRPQDIAQHHHQCNAVTAPHIRRVAPHVHEIGKRVKHRPPPSAPSACAAPATTAAHACATTPWRQT